MTLTNTHETVMHLSALDAFAPSTRRVYAATWRQFLAWSKSRTAKLELQNPFGAYQEKLSFEAGVTAKARELLGNEFKTGWHGVAYLEDVGMEALERVEQGDLRELVANLMTHHLRISGKIETVSQGTPESVPAG